MEATIKPGRSLKIHIVDEYAGKLKDSSSVFVTDFGGLTNKDLEELRKKLKPASASYLVIKDSLCKLALDKLKLPGIVEIIDGSCGLGYGSGDPVSISKVLVDFAKANKNLKLMGGYVEGKVVSADTVKELASLPSKEELIAKLIYCINSPISGLVSACSGIVKKLLYVINDIIKKKESQ